MNNNLSHLKGLQKTAPDGLGALTYMLCSNDDIMYYFPIFLATICDVGIFYKLQHSYDCAIYFPTTKILGEVE